MKKKYLFPAIPLYLAAALCLLVYYFADLHPDLVLSPASRLVLLGIFCLCAYTGSRILCKASANNQRWIMKATFLLFFVVYLSLILTLTLLDPMFGRNRGFTFIFSDGERLKNYMETSFHIVPFATISEYVGALFTHRINLSIIMTNLLGNLVAFMPLALFLPMFFRKCKRLLPFLLTTSLFVLCIELLQFVWVVGSCDIDDLILNVSGACLAYAVLRIKSVKRWIHDLCLEERKEST